MDKTISVLVLTQDYLIGLSAIRSLAMAGNTIDLLYLTYEKEDNDILLKNKDVREVIKVKKKRNRQKRIAQVYEVLTDYGKRASTKCVVIPTDNFMLYLLALYRSEFEQYFIMPSFKKPGKTELENKFDRNIQKSIAIRNGLNVLPEVYVSIKEQIMIPDEIQYPCVCRCADTIYAPRTVTKICHSKAELKKHLFGVRRNTAEEAVLIQPYISSKERIIISGLASKQQIYMPIVVQGFNISQFGQNEIIEGKVEGKNVFESVYGHIEKMISEYGYTGIFECDLYAIENQLYFDELHFHSGKFVFAYTELGINMFELLIEILLNTNEIFDNKISIESSKYVLDERAAWNEYFMGGIKKADLDALLKCDENGIINHETDIIPMNLFNKKMKAKALRVRLKPTKDYIFKLLSKSKQILLRYPQCKKENQRNFDKMRVIVIGRNYSSNLCMARALGSAGYDVEIVRVFQKKPTWRNVLGSMRSEVYSKYVKAYYTCITYWNNIRIVQFLEQISDPNNKMLLISTDDLVVSTIDLHYEELSQWYIISNINHMQGEIDRLMSKGVQKELVRKAGLPALNSCVIRTEQGIFDIPDSVAYPCFMKPNISKNSTKSKMRKCNNEEELRLALRDLSATKDIEMLIEDYIEITKEYSILGVSTKYGTCSPGAFVVEKGGHDEWKGVTMIGQVLPKSYLEPLITQINSFVATLNFEGLFDVDLIEASDGTIYFVELNLRFGGSGFAITASGVNLPAMYADYMVHKYPIDCDCEVIPGKRFVSEKIMLDEYVKGYLTMSEVIKNMKDLDIHFIKNADDMRPYYCFMKYYPFAMLKRVYKKIKR